MEFLKVWNKFFFTPTWNVFDVFVLVSVVHLMSTDSYWWALAYIPATFFSVWQQHKLEKGQECDERTH